MLSGLEAVAEESKGVMTNVRGKGFMIAFDLPSAQHRETMLDTMKQNGLYALKSGNRSIRFRGMLDTPEEAVEKGIGIVAQSIPLE
jgi:4-aminobutyrate aminotransferase-like enzyme